MPNQILAGKTPRQLADYVKDRWFIDGERNGRPTFWDRLTNTPGLTQGLVKNSMKMLGADYEGIEEAFKNHKAALNTIHPHPVYLQHKKDVLVNQHGYIQRNTWRRPWQELVDTAQASVQPFLDLMDKAYGHEPEAVDFLIQTLAFRLQEEELPRQELIIALYSPEGATGKGSLLDTIKEVAGKTAAHSTDFRSAFVDMNAAENWLGNFILLDETEVSQRDMDKLKSRVSHEEIEVNAKGKGRTRFTINAIPVLAANQKPFMDEAMARRVLLLDSRLAEKMPDQGERARYLARYKDWLRKGTDGKTPGARYLYSWLMQRDVGRYDPFQIPPNTQAKREVMEVLGTSPAQAFLSDAGNTIERSEETAALGEERILFNLTELQETYGFVKRDERYRHQLEEAGLTQPQVVRIKVQETQVKVRACLRKPWRLTTLKQKGAPLAVTDGTTTVPLALLDECAEIRQHQLL
jgi:hypothetical protein